MIPHGVEVFVGLDPIDLRWGFDRLCGVVLEKLGRNARSSALFVFYGRRKTAVKILFFDGSGLCVLYKRLDCVAPTTNLVSQSGIGPRSRPHQRVRTWQREVLRKTDVVATLREARSLVLRSRVDRVRTAVATATPTLNAGLRVGGGHSNGRCRQLTLCREPVAPGGV